MTIENQHPPRKAEPLADSWTLYGQPLTSRLLIGSALYPSPQVMQDSIQASGSQVVTLSLRRQIKGLSSNAISGSQELAGQDFWTLLKDTHCHLLPNTAGCYEVQEVITLAEMSREIFATDWLKLELLGDEYNLQPDPIRLADCAAQLIRRGFKVFPYCTDDLVLCKRLIEAGCELLMPWGSPIGTGRGLMNPYALAAIRERFPDVPLIIDAGIGLPSHACQAMEMGYDGILLNSAIAQASDPIAMAKAFAGAIQSGRTAYLAGPMPEKDTAAASTPTLGMPFWHQSSV